MTRLYRPYIPFSVRYEVLRRQLLDAGMIGVAASFDRPDIPYQTRVKAMIYHLFGDEPVRLDHDPALMLRERRGNKYNPQSNDPRYLVYRSAEGHRVKTFIRGDGAQRSDMSQRRYLKKVARNRQKQKRRRK